MKRPSATAIALLLPALLALPACRPEEEPAAAPPGPQAAAAVTTLTQENGLRILLIPVRRTPLVSISFRCDAGSDRERPREAGFSALLARILRAEEGCAEGLAGLGAALAVELQADCLAAGTTVLAADAPAAANLLLEALAFDVGDEEILRRRDRLLAELRGAVGSGLATAQDQISSALFAGSPYGVSLEEKIAALEELTPGALRSFAQRCLRPDGTVFALAGDLSASLVEAFRGRAGSWRVPSEPADGRSEAAGRAREGGDGSGTPIRIVASGGDAARLYLAKRLPPLDPETYYAVQAVNFILNGRSTYGRLTGSTVRLGLAEPISSDVQLQRGGSSWVISASCPAGRVGETLDELLGQMQLLHGGTIDNARLLEQEISDARNSLRGRLLRQTQTTGQIAAFALWSEWYGFPSPGVRDHLRLIDGIDEERLLELIAGQLAPEPDLLLAVGPAATLSRRLGELGEVEIIE